MTWIDICHLARDAATDEGATDGPLTKLAMAMGDGTIGGRIRRAEMGIVRELASGPDRSTSHRNLKRALTAWYGLELWRC